MTIPHVTQVWNTLDRVSPDIMNVMYTHFVHLLEKQTAAERWPAFMYLGHDHEGQLYCDSYGQLKEPVRSRFILECKLTGGIVLRGLRSTIERQEPDAAIPLYGGGWRRSDDGPKNGDALTGGPPTWDSVVMRRAQMEEFLCIDEAKFFDDVRWGAPGVQAVAERDGLGVQAYERFVEAVHEAFKNR